MAQVYEVQLENVDNAVARYRRLLADEVDPAERGSGLREWGSGEATIASAVLIGTEGEDRLQTGTRVMARTPSPEAPANAGRGKGKGERKGEAKEEGKGEAG